MSNRSAGQAAEARDPVDPRHRPVVLYVAPRRIRGGRRVSKVSVVTGIGLFLLPLLIVGLAGGWFTRSVAGATVDGVLAVPSPIGWAARAQRPAVRAAPPAGAPAAAAPVTAPAAPAPVPGGHLLARSRKATAPAERVIIAPAVLTDPASGGSRASFSTKGTARPLPVVGSPVPAAATGPGAGPASPSSAPPRRPTVSRNPDLDKGAEGDSKRAKEQDEEKDKDDGAGPPAEHAADDDTDADADASTTVVTTPTP
jgi:hypothetical protein